MSVSAATCGPRATAMPRWPPTATRCASCRRSRRRPSWPASSPPKRPSSCSAGPAEETRACAERAVATARAVGERAVEGRALNTFGAAMTMMGDWAGGELALREAMGIAQELSEELRHDARLRQPRRLPRQAGPARRGSRARARGRARGRARRRADPRPVPRGRRMLEAHTPGPPRRGAGDCRARAGGRAEGHGRGPGLRRRRASRAAPRPARRRRRAFPMLRASSAAARAIRTGSATRPAARPRSRSGAPIPTARGGSPPARSTSWPVASTSSPPCASTPPRCGLPPTARCARWRSATNRGPRGAARRPRDARAASDPPCFGPLAGRDGGARAGRLRGGVRRRALTRRRGSRPRGLGRRGRALRGAGMPFELAYTRWRQARGADRSPAATAAPPRSPCARPPKSPPPCGRRCCRPRSRGSRGGPACRWTRRREAAPETAELDRLGLTARELTVLALVAEGHTNREIGATLFISEKTASVHVSRILAKLGVRSRVEAATAAHRLGLV